MCVGFFFLAIVLFIEEADAFPVSFVWRMERKLIQKTDEVKENHYQYDSRL